MVAGAFARKDPVFVKIMDMNQKGLSWIGAVFVLAIGGILLFCLLQVQTLFKKTQHGALKQMQGVSVPARPACDEAAGVCPLEPVSGPAVD